MATEPRIKGVSLYNHLEFVTNTFGEAATAAVILKVPPRSAEAVRAAVAFEWYPLQAIADLDQTIVEAHYGGDASQAWRMGAYSFEKHVTTIYRVLMHTLQTSFVLKKSGALAARVVDGSTVDIHQDGPTSAVIKMGGYSSPSPVFCHLVRGAMMGILFACGHRDATVEHLRCDPAAGAACEYKAKWA